MSIDHLRSHYGFTRSPFGRELAPQMLFPSHTHQEAVARISWLIDEAALGVITGEVGSGKTVAARAAVPSLDHRHTVVYLGNPAIGIRGYYSQIVEALGGCPPFHTADPRRDVGCPLHDRLLRSPYGLALEAIVLPVPESRAVVPTYTTNETAELAGRVTRQLVTRA